MKKFRIIQKRLFAHIGVLRAKYNVMDPTASVRPLLTFSECRVLDNMMERFHKAASEAGLV